MDKVYSMLGLAKRARALISGETGCIQSIKRNECKLLILAEDASDNTKDKLISIAKKYKMEYVIFGNKSELAKAIGKEYTAAIAILDDNFTKAILDLIKPRSSLNNSGGVIFD